MVKTRAARRRVTSTLILPAAEVPQRGTTQGKIGFHGGKVTVHRPRVRSFDGHEVALPSWTAAQAEDWLGRWAMNLMLINVSTRKLRPAVRFPQGDLPIMGRHLEVGGLAPVRGAVGRGWPSGWRPTCQSSTC